MDDFMKVIQCLGTMLLFLLHLTSADVINLEQNNLDTTLKSHELVLVNFYADWCHFSQMLTPIFAETATKAKQAFPDQGKVALAKVDCDREVVIAQKFSVNKYPTLKLFRHGEVMKREYRGQRSVDGMIEFLKDQLNDRILEVPKISDVKFEDDKRYVVASFESKKSPNFVNLRKVATQFRDDCTFILLNKSPESKESIFSKSAKGTVDYNGQLGDFTELAAWARSRCVPLVRTITFANAEELTEEGLPFLLLFHKKDDVETPKLFEEAVIRDLGELKNTINALKGDGEQFSHPLHHLGKGVGDLPVICIDSFRHMFLYPKDTMHALKTPGVLKKFVEDLHSGKLHREFHNGPDPEVVTPAPEEPKQPPQEAPAGPSSESTPSTEERHVPRDGSDGSQKRGDATTPPSSMFRLLQPSSNRYTLLRDEL